MTDALLDVDDLSVSFGASHPAAVSGVSLRVEPGELIGVVGESGSGKTALCRAILGILPPPGRVVGGDVRFRGRSLLADGGQALRDVRGKAIGYIPQDSANALNPVMSVQAHLIESLRAHTKRNRREVTTAAGLALEEVGLTPDVARAYPHELSGGMLQRVLIALALMPGPALLLADEPTSALDVIVQRKILGLLSRVARERGTAAVLVSHDIGVVRRLCRRVVVLYAGTVVESGPTARILDRPAHPYTRALLAALPSSPAHPIPSAPEKPPGGCVFRDRCPISEPRCATAPRSRRTSPGHDTACHLATGVEIG